MTGHFQPTAQDTSSTAWCFAKQGYLHVPFFEAVGALLPQRLPQFGAQEHPESCCLPAGAGDVEQCLGLRHLAAVLRAPAGGRGRGGPAEAPHLEVAGAGPQCWWQPLRQELANSIWALARLAYAPSEVFQKMGDRLLELRRHFEWPLGGRAVRAGCRTPASRCRRW